MHSVVSTRAGAHPGARGWCARGWCARRGSPWAAATLLLCLSVGVASAEVPREEVAQVLKRTRKDRYMELERRFHHYASEFSSPAGIPGLRPFDGSTPRRLRGPLSKANNALVKQGSALGAHLFGLGRDAVWVDAGAGYARAQRDYRELGGEARLVAVGLSLPTRNLFKALSLLAYQALPHHRFRYVGQGPIEQLPEQKRRALFGRVDVITDVFGAFAYSDRLDRVLATYASMLKVGGRAYVTFDADTRLEDARGRKVPVAEWIGSVGGLRVTQLHDPYSLLIEKTQEEVRVPRLDLLYLRFDYPSRRGYRIVD
ncbi:MAG: hypothetical protein IT371_23230 [Deltaproteobacteria bacterium]|nr:hypothetical protein [Deltaproteobacteria bacterium]